MKTFAKLLGLAAGICLLCSPAFAQFPSVPRTGVCVTNTADIYLPADYTTNFLTKSNYLAFAPGKNSGFFFGCRMHQTNLVAAASNMTFRFYPALYASPPAANTLWLLSNSLPIDIVFTTAVTTNGCYGTNIPPSRIDNAPYLVLYSIISGCDKDVIIRSNSLVWASW